MTTGSTNSIIAHTDWYATIEVTTTVGTMVTCNGVTKEATTGYVSFTVYKSGTYTITGTLNGHTNSITQYVSSAQYYYVTLYMSSTIRVNAPVNTVVTVDGQSQTVTGTYVDFTVYSTGTYTVTGVLNGITATNTVYVGNMGQTYSTTLVFGCYVNIYSNIGTDVIYNGLRQTVGDTGYVRYWITGTGTHKFLCIYKGQSKARDVVVTSTASDIDESIYFVPSAYQQVEWIQSSGTQYIDTGVKATSTGGVYFKGYGTSSYSLYGLQGSGTGTSSLPYYGATGTTLQSSAGNFYIRAGKQSFYLTTQHFGELFEIRQDKEKVYVNGSLVSTLETMTFNSTYTIILFARHNSDGSVGDKGGNVRCHSFKMWDNGTLIRVFVPCKRVSDNEIGMYDIINDVFYTNAGTDSFTAGPMANLPAEYQELEYLKSDGYSWIDTGVNGQSANNFEVDILVPTGGQFSLGGYNNSTPYNRNYLVLRSITIAENGFVGSGGSGYYQIPSNTISLNTRQLIKSKFINGVANFTVNGRIISLIHSGTDGDYFNGNIYLFGINIVGGTSSGTIATVYSCKIYSTDNTTLLRCFIPCKRKSDSVLGMYDIVNGVFYENAGTGTFTAGPSVNASLPSEYTYVKYIASTSAKTQYLNLGETGTNTSGMLIKVYDELESTTKDNVYVGGRATQNGRFWVGGTYWGDNVQSYLTYLGWNTLKRLVNAAGEYTETISATKTLRTFYINYLNNRQEGYDSTKAFDITETLVQNTPLYAFAASNNGSVALNSWMRLYYTVLTSGTSVSNIFIPCYRNSDNVIGMYDIVKGNFKTNAGSGSFVDGGYLPSTYQQVEYLKSDGYSWINTDVSSDVTASWNIKTRIMNFDNNRKVIVGSYLSDDESCLAIEFGGTSNSHARQIRHFIYSGPNSGGSHYEWISQACTLNTILDTKLIWNFTTKQLYTSFTENNYTYSTTNNYSSYTFRQTGTSNFLLFSDSRASRAAISYPLAIYSCTIEKNGNIVRNFIPCYRKSDNVAGMFDTENMVFYENSGTGTFTVGPDVN